jgi:hypothetical protein
MALSGTNRGTGGNNTASTTINISPASNFTVGSVAILAIAYDNAGSGGSDNFSSITDSNNTWNLMVNQLNDPGAANAGSVLRLYYSNVISLTTSNSITITFSANVTAKAWTLTEILSDIGSIIYSSIGAGGLSGNGTTQTINQFVINGGCVFGVLGQEGNGTRTGDSDTNNGSWSTAQSIGFGTTTGGQEIITQFKISTAQTTQTYNPTTSPIGDWNIAAHTFDEIIYTFSDPFGQMGFFGI